MLFHLHTEKSQIAQEKNQRIILCIRHHLFDVDLHAFINTPYMLSVSFCISIFESIYFFVLIYLYLYISAYLFCISFSPLVKADDL